MGKQNKSLQNIFLEQLQRSGSRVYVVFLNKHQIEGEIKGFDNFCIILEEKGKQHLIYKHAIACIIPEKKIYYRLETEETENEVSQNAGNRE